jgi:Hint domain
MSTISISTSNTVANLNGLIGLGPTEAILTADSLTGVTVDVDLGIASAFTVIGSPDSDVTLNPADESIIPISVLSTLFVDTNGADVTLDEGALASVGALSGTTIDVDGGTFQMGSGLITASLLNSTSFGFGPNGGTDLITKDSTFLPINLLNSEGPITGFDSSKDVINDQALDFADITGYSIATESGGEQVVTILTSDNSNLTFAVAGGSLTSGSFAQNAGPLHMNDVTNGLAITPLCFQQGTRILTPTGEKPIETLTIGDRVVTRFGGIQPIEWIGRQSYDARFLRNNPAKVPVRIAAGALGPNLPVRALSVSPGHSLLLGDVLVLASTLLNGITITQTLEADAGPVEYYQIDLGEHDCVIAEGTWAETFADAPGMRAQFHNAAAYDALYPDRPPVQQQTLCVPRPEHGPALEAALRPVAAIAAAGTSAGPLEGYIDLAESWKIFGWAIDLARPGLPVLLEVLSAEESLGTVLACDPRADLAAAGKGIGRCGFAFTPLRRLSPEALATLQIRRVEDGAALGMTDGCHTAIFGEPPPAPQGIRIAS